MIPEATKLRDAIAILSEMRGDLARKNTDAFRRHACSFLHTARSVMQYLWERAKKTNRHETWYPEVAAASVWCKVFRDLRDADIHERPFHPVAAHHITVPVDEVPGGQPDGRRLVTFSHKIVPGNSTRLSIDEDGNPVTVLKLGDKASVVPDLSAKGVSLRSEFVIEVNGKDQPLIACCEQYLRELVANIQKARADGIIEE